MKFFISLLILFISARATLAWSENLCSFYFQPQGTTSILAEAKKGFQLWTKLAHIAANSESLNFPVKEFKSPVLSILSSLKNIQNKKMYSTPEFDLALANLIKEGHFLLKQDYPPYLDSVVFAKRASLFSSNPRHTPEDFVKNNEVGGIYLNSQERAFFSDPSYSFSEFRSKVISFAKDHHFFIITANPLGKDPFVAQFFIPLHYLEYTPHPKVGEDNRLWDSGRFMEHDEGHADIKKAQIWPHNIKQIERDAAILFPFLEKIELEDSDMKARLIDFIFNITHQAGFSPRSYKDRKNSGYLVILASVKDADLFRYLDLHMPNFDK